MASTLYMTASLRAGATPGQALGVPCHSARVMLGSQVGEREDTWEVAVDGSGVCRLPGAKLYVLVQPRLEEQSFRNISFMCLMVQMFPVTRGMSRSISSIVVSCLLQLKSCLLQVSSN